jgi:decaprenylphospho-beta-D-ribofuranose 2-oxidase
MRKVQISSFDGTESYECSVQRPEKYQRLFDTINMSNNCIIRGAGLTYCMASGGYGITSVDFTKFNRILAFDGNLGHVKVEAGISVGVMLSFIIKKGWYFPVLPGYPTITIGGCLANNVHGKSQFKSGNFGNHVIEFNLYHPDHGEITCSRTENEEIFNLTTGGLGLTGVILNVTLALEPLKGCSVEKQKVPCGSLTEAVAIMSGQKEQYENVYSWNNLNLGGKHFGKGIVYLEQFSREVLPGKFRNYQGTIDSESRKSFIPGLLNRMTTPIECAGYYFLERMLPGPALLSIEAATFPIYGKEIYFNLFGKKGLREYQLIIPESGSESFFYELEKMIRQYRVPIALGSLKLFRGKSRYLNFCQDGICLAIDIPARDKYLEFFHQLDLLVIHHHGIANLSKDSRLSIDGVSNMYSEYADFKAQLLKFDPGKRFNSQLRERIGV